LLYNIDISQGSVATHLRRGGIYSDSTSYRTPRYNLSLDDWKDERNFIIRRLVKNVIIEPY